MKDRQINCRIDEATLEAFKRAVELNHTTQNDALRTLIDTYIASADEKSIRHLDGSLCPLSELIRGLAERVREMRL